MPRLSASPEQKRALVAQELASTNTTANAFLGSKRPAWLTANARPPAPGPAPAPTAAPTTTPTTNTTSSSIPTAAPETAQSVAPPPSSQPAPAEAPSPSSPTPNPDPKTTVTNLSQSDSSLLSPAPTDEASPSAASPTATVPVPTNTEESSRVNDFPSLRRALSEERRRRAGDDAQPMGAATETAENEASNEQTQSPMPANDVAGPPQRPSTPTDTASTSAAGGGAVTEATTRSPEVAGQSRFALIVPDDAVSRPPAPTSEAAVEAILAEASTPDAPPTTGAPTAPAPTASPTASAPAATTPAASVPKVSAHAASAPAASVPAASTPTVLAEAAPPASPSRSGSYFPRLIIRAQYSNDKFEYAPWVPVVQRQIVILKREGTNFTYTEILRMSTLVNTCQTEDGFFVAVNQLLSLWQLNPIDVYSRMCSLQPHIIGSAFSILQKVLKTNGEIRPSLLKWMSEFPHPVDKMLADDIKFDRVILQVAACLKKLVQHWSTMENCVMARGYPLLVDELLSQLFCISPALQKYLSGATRRNLVTIELSDLKPEEIFLEDQKQHQPNPNTLISLPEDRFEQFLEQINATTIASYRKCLQAPQSPPKRGRGRPPKQHVPQSPAIFGYVQQPPGPSTAQTGQQPATGSQTRSPNQIQQTQQAQQAHQIANAQRQSQQFLDQLAQVPLAFSSQPGVPNQSIPQTSPGSPDISASYLPIGVSNIAPVPRTNPPTHPRSNGTQPIVAHHARRPSLQQLQQQQQLQLQAQQSSRPPHQGSPVMMGPPTSSNESPFSRHPDTVTPGPASPHILQSQSPQLAHAQQNFQQAQQAHQDAANQRALMVQRAQFIQAQQMHIQNAQRPQAQFPVQQGPSQQVPSLHPSQQAQFAQVPSQQSMPQQSPGQQRVSVATASLEEKKRMLAYHQEQEKLRLEENHRQQMLQLQREQEEQEAQRQQHAQQAQQVHQTQQAHQAHQALLAQQSRQAQQIELSERAVAMNPQQHQQMQQWQHHQLQQQRHVQQQVQDPQNRQAYARQQLELQGQPVRQVYQGQQHPLQQQGFIQSHQQQYPQQHLQQHPQQNPPMQAQMQHLQQVERIQQMRQMQQYQPGQPAPEAPIASPTLPQTQSWPQPMQGSVNPTGQPGRMAQTGRPIQPSLPRESPHSPAQSPVQSPNLAQQALRPRPAGPPATRQTFYGQNATAVSNNALVQPSQVPAPPQPVAALPPASNTASPAQQVAGMSPFGMLVPQAQPHQQRQLLPGPQQQRGRPSGAVQGNAGALPPGPSQRKWPSTSIFPPPGATISRSEFPLDPNDFRASQMSLTQLDRRSPPRVVVNRETNRVISPKGINPAFYQFVQGLALGPCPTPMRKTMYSFKFSISEEDFALRSFRSESVNGSHLQVENHFDGSLNYRIRCCTARRSAKAITESDWVVTNTQWPVNIFIKINGTPVFVRRQSHNGKDLPVGITRLVKPGVNTVEVAIPEETVYKPSASTNYFFAVETIETAHSNRTLEYIKTHRVDEPSVTIDKIKARLQPSSNKDDEFAILQDSVSVDLADPFSARIFKIPVRGDQCTHIECFDMYNWFSTRPASKTATSGACMHRLDCDCPKTQEPTVIDKWKCPICSKDARPRSLRVDRFLVDVRAKLKEEGKLGKVKSILVGADGEWKPVAEDEEDDGNDDSGDDEASTAGAGTNGGINVAKRKQGAQQQQQNGQPPRKVSRTNYAPSVVASAARPVAARQIDVIEIDD